MNPAPALHVAIRAARRAGQIALQQFDRPEKLEIHEKAPHDLVTSADLAVEKELMDQLSRGYPQYGFLTEESGSHRPHAEFQWIIDPIDGTTNFVRGIPHFAISIALARRGEVVAGVVHDPFKDETFTAEKGGGAFFNERRIRVSGQERLSHALLGTGFPFRHRSVMPSYLKAFGQVMENVSEVRRAGSAALDLAYVAAGRFDGFWEMRLAPWDIAAGQLLVTEAGGYVCSVTGEKDYMKSGDIVAATPGIHEKLLHLLQGAGLHQAPKRG
ncbi:Inositol-phosphate phosphatase [Magnetococcus marinus MC-1]|uniref:Inositol-1-monophosphatase n=1 Tax=Magnetococcus marinus (strain ATCC BAA-1437 / JCM 17883 / MC-1) TaxID=156889 RepID=A0L3R4_MAGMM|nr:inositol monophosphatase family protein [Magnetococcus marinus]ABK42607.1 Inositol-phosphate phosphatase [Magnetococcus marinus MC-1]